VLLFAAALLGCSGGADVATRAPTGLEGTWVADVVAHPDVFAAHMGAARDGWIALHKNAWLDAAAAPGAPTSRAQAELSTFHGVLAGISADAWRSLGDTWERRGTLPTDSALPVLVALSAKDAGDEIAAAHWLKLPSRADPATATRVGLHDDLRKGTGDLAALRVLAASPLLEEPLPEGKRTLYDPLVHHTLSLGYQHAAAAAPLTDPLDRTLFSGIVDAADASPAASRAKLGLVQPATDDAEVCRESVRTLDKLLDGWKVQLGATAPADGQALLRDLQLVEGFRARLLVDWGVDALHAEQPRCALALAEMAMDHENARAVTPVNSPTLFAVLAAANLHTGHTREALDALQVLVEPFPEAGGLDETVGVLAVLQGLDRTGDSREN
jgi:hypothetical protein